jgi:hypothetical protein
MAVESGMIHIAGFDRSQLVLLPEAVDDYVGVDNPVRFIDAFVVGLDLAAMGFARATPAGTMAREPDTWLRSSQGENTVGRKW